MDVQLAIEAYLLSCGFTTDLHPGSDRGRVFHGVLDRAGIEPIKVRIVILDWSLSRYPIIVINEGERHYNTSSAHVNYDRSLCYIVPGQVVLNSHAPESAIERCLVAASELISRLDADDPELLDDYRDEFDVYWSNDFSQIFAEDEISESYYLLYIEDQVVGWLAPESHDPKSVFYRRITDNGKKGPVGNAFVLEIDECWPVTRDCPLPETMNEFLEWIRVNSPKKLWELLSITSNPYFWVGPCPSVVLKTPRHILIGVFKKAEFASVSEFSPRELANRGHMKLYDPQNILAKLPMVRGCVKNAGADAIYSRNGEPSLKGKNILVIGGGAIGGFLTDALAMVGAGTANGSMTIIDNDILETGNLTRHSLGISDLNVSKADAIEKKLNREMPYVSIKSIPGDAQRHLSFDYDIIIDATGQEAFSRWLNGQHLSYLNKGGVTPVLYIWLEGEGTAWRSLLVDQLGAYACRECLYIHGEDGDRSIRFPHTDEPVNYRHVGCKTIVPYAATAAMQAAALACDAAVDWYQGQPSPRFRGVHRSGRVYEAFTDRDLKKQEGCPACSKT
jgi:hypothetical protein